MKIIQKIAKDFFKSYGYQRKLDVEYVDSKYIIEHTYKDVKIIFNLLTSEIIVLNNNEQIDDNFAITHWYKFDKNIDQYSFAYGLITYRKNKDTPTITDKAVIFTTMDCNARCYYCFENGRSDKKRMSDKIAYDTAQYFINKSKKLAINWFGGEPLVNPNAIRIITKEFKDNNIVFTSNITTNGYLINEFSIYELKYKWNVSEVQITLDGTEDIYLKSKNYVNNDPNAFKRVVDNIFWLSNNGIHVAVRFNVSLFNKEDLKTLILELLNDSRFNENISMYAFRLMAEPTNTIEDEIQLNRDDIELNRLIVDKLGFSSSTKRFLRYSNVYCMSDSSNCDVVNVDGQIGRCEHFSESNTDQQICSIYNPICDIKKIKPFMAHRNLDKCKECKLYPNCNLSNLCEALIPCDEIGLDYQINLVKYNLERFYKSFIEYEVQENNPNELVVSIMEGSN